LFSAYGLLTGNPLTFFDFTDRAVVGSGTKVKKRRSEQTLSKPRPLVRQAFDKPFDKLKAMSISNGSGPESIEGLTIHGIIPNEVEDQPGESKG
jgi:hypothetical protein